MKRKTLRTLSSIMCLLFLVSIFQAPLLANTATIAVNVGGQTLNVTPGQWVTVRSASGTSHYNVRFVDGKPVALEMSQYTQIVFGDGAAAGQAGQAAQTGQAAQSGQSGQSAQTSQSNQSAQTSQSNQSAQTSQSNQSAQTSQSNQSAQTSQSSSQSSQTSQSNWDPAKHPRDPKTGKFISVEEANKIAQANQGGGTGSVADGSNAQSAQISQSNQSAQTNQGANQSGQTSQTSNQSAQTSQSSSQTAQTDTTVKKSNWDPAKHPRDPQTGRFISIEEAIERGLYEGGNTNAQASQGSGDASQAAQTGSGDASQSAQADQSWDAAQTSGDSSQAAQQTSGDAAQADQSAGDSTKPGVGDKFKSGYETGKGMANQGFQNVKDSLKSGFSAKNILVTAGITVGVDLATQVMRGEQPSIKSALKTVASAEFVGGVTGSVLGAATGSFFTPFLAGVPVVGGALSALAPVFGSIVGSSMGAYLAGDIKNGRFSIKEAFKRIDWVGVTGQTIGSTAGAALGSFLGPVGTVVGGIVGGYVGNWAAQRIAGLFSKNKSADLPTLTMPVGTGSGKPVVGGGNVTVGDTVKPSTGGSVATSKPEPESTVTDTGIEGVYVSGDFSANDAYAAYSMLYKQYSDLIAEGNMQDALKVANQMNAAKALYDQLLQQEQQR
jgi:hypothetical protein